MEEETGGDLFGGHCERGPSALRALLRSLIGKPLTVQAAADILICSSASVIRVEPKSLPVETYRTWRFERASVEDVWPEVRELHKGFWREVSDHGRGIEPDPDPIRFASAEYAGRYVMLVVRDTLSGEVVGFCGMHFSFAMRAQLVVAHEDGMYIRPDHRKGWMFRRFMNYVERCCVTLGAEEMRVDASVGIPTNRALIGMGFTHVANHYIKITGERHVA